LFVEPTADRRALEPEEAADSDGWNRERPVPVVDPSDAHAEQFGEVADTQQRVEVGADRRARPLPRHRAASTLTPERAFAAR
jgi:hypothetical protein